MGTQALYIFFPQRKQQYNNVCSSVTFSEGLIIDVTLYVANSYNGRHGGGRTCTHHFPRSGKSGQRDTISQSVMYNFMTKEKKLYKVKRVFHSNTRKLVLLSLWGL